MTEKGPRSFHTEYTLSVIVSPHTADTGQRTGRGPATYSVVDVLHAGPVPPPLYSPTFTRFLHLFSLKSDPAHQLLVYSILLPPGTDTFPSLPSWASTGWGVY